MKKILDLRFVIGVFSSLIGLLLLVSLFFANSADNVNLNVTAGWSVSDAAVNRWCGIIFVAFGLLMILLSFTKDADDELLQDAGSWKRDV